MREMISERFPQFNESVEDIIGPKTWKKLLELPIYEEEPRTEEDKR